ncbi:hypothetical protein ABE402_11150 [Bacillus smithii]|uniref:hypothetical protein n=1 Tax=Bacillus smithii TaxID=1479 RepID=UPI003D1C726F
MNNLETYINMEKESGKKGMGDKFEAAHVLTGVSVKMYDPNTNELIASGTSSNLHFRINGDEKRPIYCMFAIDGSVLDVVGEDDEFYHAKINLSDDQIERLINEFGEQMFLVDPKAFIERVTAVFDENGYSYRAGLVRYDDYGVNSSKRLESYRKQDTDIYFWKDEFFEYQNEYRIVLTDQEIEEPLIVNIGDISDISISFKASEFFNGKFELHIKK